ncbi:hypothetical protein HELRODRAFT_153542, partial [Helobdella robusta]|uniref:RING-type domain-containing protein n=1 Tax=Helobdella robusta TaxID=6412 RepID=T1EL87_HELRO
EKDLENMPIIRYEGEDCNEDSCNICLGQYKRGDALKRLNCKHEYHSGCINVWLKRNITCPMCR